MFTASAVIPAPRREKLDMFVQTKLPFLRQRHWINWLSLLTKITSSHHLLQNVSRIWRARMKNIGSCEVISYWVWALEIIWSDYLAPKFCFFLRDFPRRKVTFNLRWVWLDLSSRSWYFISLSYESKRELEFTQQQQNTHNNS